MDPMGLRRTYLACKLLKFTSNNVSLVRRANFSLDVAKRVPFLKLLYHFINLLRREGIE